MKTKNTKSETWNHISIPIFFEFIFIDKTRDITPFLYCNQNSAGKNTLENADAKK